MMLDIGNLISVNLLVKTNRGKEFYLVMIASDNLTCFYTAKETDDFEEAMNCFKYYRDQMRLQRSKQ